MWRLGLFFSIFLKGFVLVIITTNTCVNDGRCLAHRQRGIAVMLILHPQRHHIVHPHFEMSKESLIYASLNTLRQLMMRSSGPIHLLWFLGCKEQPNCGSWWCIP